MPASYPFLLGAQYYRAPTPEPACWEGDLKRMRELGFNSVKYWVQWRWSHRREDRFEFGDLDRLMDLAAANGLGVTLNVIFDISPDWLFEKYPDAKQIANNGRVVEPYEVAQRQLGGHPGPCYNHPDALRERQAFLAATVEHFRAHPALAMWDIWNEPELCFPQRSPDLNTLVCYCPHCRSGFIGWLQDKYTSIDKLNVVWGRCHETWTQVELPRSGQTITDFVDWREFHTATMTREAAWRLAMVKARDPAHVRYLHVVPNVMTHWNSVTCCSDDFELAPLCDVFAATMNGGPMLASHVLSAANQDGAFGKVCYNVESHVNWGSTNMHQRVLGMEDLLQDFLPQIGLGIKGFLFWQYRPEILGLESPAWGVVDLDGGDRSVTRAVRAFAEKLAPHMSALLRCFPRPAEIGIWKSRRNEIFHFCVHRELGSLAAGIDAYVQAFYWHNQLFRFVSESMLERGAMQGLRLLVMPSPYYVTEAEARGLDAWVRSGGVLLAEAHLAGYNGTSGRHARSVPGCGLAQAWGIRESESTSSFHLKLENPEQFAGTITEDGKKALAQFGTSGGEAFPIRLVDGGIVWGARRYAALEGDSVTAEGRFDVGAPCIVSVKVGKGQVVYCGTDLGLGAKRDVGAFAKFVLAVAARAGVSPTGGQSAGATGQVRLDLLEHDGTVRYAVVQNRSSAPQDIRLGLRAGMQGLFSGVRFDITPEANVTIPGGFTDLLEVLGSDHGEY